jgi:hypothetical protein
MGHGPAAFKETDVVRAVRAIAKAGQPVAGVKFDRDGGFTVVIGKAGDTVKLNSWDEVLKENGQN